MSMASFKKKSELEYNNGNNKISESFDFNVEASMNGLGEDFVFKFEDNKVTATNDVALTGLEENDESASNASAKSQNIDDNNQQRNRNNNNDNSTETTPEAEAASESAAASSSSASSSAATSSSAGATATTASASVASAVGTVAAVATSAVVLVVGGSLAVYGQTLEKPQIVEFESLSSTENTIKFTLLVGNDRNSLDSKEQEDASIIVELTCEGYSDFQQEIQFNKYGRLENEFSELLPSTEYTINVLQISLMDLNKDYLIEPIKISTIGNVIAPVSFAISPAQTRVEVEQSVNLSITDVLPENAETDVVWTSSNERIATVNENGVVTGVSYSETPITITATSLVSSMVKATATIYVDPATPKYSPTFEKVTDPFGNTEIYMTVDVRHETRTFDYIELTAKRLDRNTGEIDPNYGECYCTLREAITSRQKITFTEETFYEDALYKIIIEGYIPEEGEVDPDTGSFIPTKEGELVTLYENNFDFALISSSTAGVDFHNNQIYLRKTELLAGNDFDILETSYDVYLDTADVTNGLYHRTSRADGSDEPLYIGIYPNTADDYSYPSQEKITEFIVEQTRTTVPISLDETNIFGWNTYTFVAFRVVAGEDARNFEEIFRNDIYMDDIPHVQQRVAEEMVFEKEIDPFGATTVYCQFKQRGSMYFSNGYFDFVEIDPDTKEELGDHVYCNLGEADITERNVMRMTDGEFKNNGYYKYSFEVSYTSSTGTTATSTLIVDEEVDFSKVPTTTISTEGTNDLYLQQRDVTDADGNIISSYHYYNAYLSLEDESSIESSSIVVGVFPSSIADEDATYRSNDMLSSFTMSKFGEIQEHISFDVTDLDELETYKFVVFEMKEGTQTFERIFSKIINLEYVSYGTVSFVGNISMEMRKSYYSAHQIILTMGGSLLSTLTNDWTVSVYDTVEDTDTPIENVDFTPYDSYGEKFSHIVSYDQDPLYLALISNNNEKELRVKAEIPTDTDAETYVIAKLSGIDPADLQDEAYIDGCAEFGYETVSSATSQMCNMFITLHMSEDLFYQYDSITISGYIDQMPFRIEVTSIEQLNAELACIGYDEQAGTSTDSQIQVDINAVEGASKNYYIYGNTTRYPEPILIFEEYGS